MKSKIQELYALEQLAGGNTCVHRLHPAVKLLATAVFIITVVSFDRYSFGRLVPCIFYPALMMAFSETPYSMLLKRFLIALPFCLFAGLANILFDRDTAFTVGGMAVSYGLLSFFTILFRVYLSVMAVLILVSVTPLLHIKNSMRRLRIPHIFITVFEMTYRYIGVLLEEAYSMYAAYSLRNAAVKGIEIRDMGSFAGQLLIRSIDRADRVYNAMKCRGYALHSVEQSGGKLTKGDVIFLAVICLLCAVCRFVDVNALFAGILRGFR
jgi:cobalt/nickel transport system permease protein